MSSVAYRKQQIKRRRQHGRRWHTSTFSMVAGVIGLLLLVAALYPTLQREQGSDATYSEADVAREAPFVAQHEMGEGPPIPFLPTGGPQPNIVVPHTRFDFGRIGPQDVVERTFILRNDGDAPLTISRAYTNGPLSCYYS